MAKVLDSTPGEKIAAVAGGMADAEVSECSFGSGYCQPEVLSSLIQALQCQTVFLT